MSAAGSSIVAPAESAIGDSLNIHADYQLQLVFSIFLLGYVIGPLLLAPLSEIYGRAVVLRFSNLFFIAFSLGCGFAQTYGQMLTCRLLAGVGASAPQTVGGGVLSDCFSTEERGKAVALYSLAPVLGPSLGPLIGGFVTAKTTWRWCFWILTMFGGLVQAGLWFGLKETYGPRILTLKAAKMRKEKHDLSLKSELEFESRGLISTLERALIRPVRLIGTQVIVQFLAIYMALVYGIIFLMLGTFPSMWTEKYGERIEIGGLNYISIAIGMIVGAQVAGRWLDLIYRRLKDRSPTKLGRPEYRIPLLALSIALISGGLFIYGWTAEYRVQWIAPDIGAAVFAAGAMVSMTSLQSYIIDAYPRYAASAIGVTAIARSLAGFGFPLFAGAMFKSLGFGWGNTVLAFASIVVGLPGAAVLWVFGEKLRRASPYAANV